MELNYSKTGHGEPLVILHGLFGSSDNWRSLAMRMGSHFTVYALDLRNHNRSPHIAPHDYPSMSEDIFEFIQNNIRQPVHIIGHSMGGKVAMKFAFSYPAFVSSLIVADISPRNYGRLHSEIIDALTRVNLNQIQTRQDADNALAFSIAEVGVRQFLLKSLYRTEEGIFAWRFNLPQIVKNYDEIVAGVYSSTPFLGKTLFIRGGNSNYITDTDDLPIITQLFPNSDLVTLPGVGHWVHAEAPEHFLKAVGAFHQINFPAIAPS